MIQLSLEGPFSGTTTMTVKLDRNNLGENKQYSNNNTYVELPKGGGCVLIFAIEDVS